MEENMNLDHELQYDFMGVGAQHDDDEISPVEHERHPEQENMNLIRGSQHSFIDFMGVGAQHDDNIDDPQEHDPAPENMNLDRGYRSSYIFIDFMGLSAQHGDEIDIDIDDLIPQEPDPAQVHHHQKASTCSDVDNDDALLEERFYSLMELLPKRKVERDRPEDRPVRLDLDMRLLPGSSMRLLRQEGPQFLTLQLGPTSDSALEFGPDLGPCA